MPLQVNVEYADTDAFAVASFAVRPVSSSVVVSANLIKGLSSTLLAEWNASHYAAPDQTAGSVLKDQNDLLWYTNRNMPWDISVQARRARMTYTFASGTRIDPFYSVSETAIINPGTQSTNPTCIMAAKCCPRDAATITAFTLLTSLDPVTCTSTTATADAIVPASLQYELVLVAHQWHATTVTGSATIYVAQSNATRPAVITFSLSSSADVVVTVDHSLLNMTRLWRASSMRLCRSGASLSNTASPSPVFLAHNWLFGTASRQVGYTLSTYVTEKQCNGMPLGLLTSFDGNNNDQFSIERSNSIASAWVEGCSWTDELTATQSNEQGAMVTYAVGVALSCEGYGSIRSSVQAVFHPDPAAQRPFLRVSALLRIISAESRLVEER